MKKLNKEQKEALLAAIDKLDNIEQNINANSKKDIQEIIKTVNTILNQKNESVKQNKEIEDNVDYDYELTLRDVAQKAININNELINVNLVLSELDNNEKHIKLYVRTVQMLLLNYHNYYSLIK